MSRARPVIGPHPKTGVPTTWPSGAAAAIAWRVTRACICHWLRHDRPGWSYADGVKPERKLATKRCAVCAETFRQRPDERNAAFGHRKTCSDDCASVLINQPGEDRPHVVDQIRNRRAAAPAVGPQATDTRRWEILGVTDYPARSRGFLLAYTLACICLGGAMVAAVFVYGPKVEAPAEEAAPVITDQHWSGTE